MFVAELPKSFEKAFRGDVYAALALDGLHQDRRCLRAGELPRGFQVAERGVDESGGHRAKALL